MIENFFASFCLFFHEKLKKEEFIKFTAWYQALGSDNKGL